MADPEKIGVGSSGDLPHNSKTHSSASSITGSEKRAGDSTNIVNSGNARNSLTRLDSKVIDVKDTASDDEEMFKHLTPEEAEIIKRQLDIPVVNLGYFDLFRYATFNDKLILAAAVFAAIAGGAILPLMTIIFGSLTGVFQKFTLGTMAPDKFSDELNTYTL